MFVADGAGGLRRADGRRGEDRGELGRCEVITGQPIKKPVVQCAHCGLKLVQSFKP